MMAQQGKRVLLIGCDPKSDTTSLLFGGRSCPTIIETSSKKKPAGEQVQIGDVCFKRDGVFAMELGGPEVGRGCGGRGIIHGFELLEKLGFHEWGFDYVLLDFLGDVVCGGFGLPIARDMCQKVIVVGSNDLQSLYVANNVCSAVDYFRKLGGNVGVAGMVINKDDGTGEAQAFAKAVGIPVLAAIPADEDIRRKSANYEIIGKPGGALGVAVRGARHEVAEAPPVRPTPLTHEALLGLFKGDAVGRDVVLIPRPSTTCARRRAEKQSLEVVYEGAPEHVARATPAIDRRLPWRARDGCRRARRAAARPARARCWTAMRRIIRAGRMTSRNRMCPAFGSLRVGPADAPHGDDPVGLGLLRLRTDLHLAFLRRAAQRRLRAVQLRDAGQAASSSRTSATRCSRLAKPDDYDAVVVINLCVPTASGVPLDLLPKQIDGVRIIGIDVPGFGVPTHAEAKDVLAGAMLRYARGWRPSTGRSRAAPAGRASSRP